MQTAPVEYSLHLTCDTVTTRRHAPSKGCSCWLVRKIVSRKMLESSLAQAVRPRPAACASASSGGKARANSRARRSASIAIGMEMSNPSLSTPRDMDLLEHCDCLTRGVHGGLNQGVPNPDLSSYGPLSLTGSLSAVFATAERWLNFTVLTNPSRERNLPWTCRFSTTAGDESAR
jgi:hypothetical protein